MTGQILDTGFSILVKAIWLWLIVDLLREGIKRLRMPKHFTCGSKWHVRRVAYYYDVPLYRCSKCEPNPIAEEATFFVATEDDGELLRDHLLADEAEEGPLTPATMWKHITASPRPHG